MISEVNIPALLRLIRNNEQAKSFCLMLWIAPCETYGCLVGNDWLATHPGQVFPGAIKAIEEYGLAYKTNHLVYHFLFEAQGIKFRYEKHESKAGEMVMVVRCPPRNIYDREVAINRVRKFVYYVLHKRELLYDDRGCIRESIRRAEGNHNVVAGVLERIASERQAAYSPAS